MSAFRLGGPAQSRADAMAVKYMFTPLANGPEEEEDLRNYAPEWTHAWSPQVAEADIERCQREIRRFVLARGLSDEGDCRADHDYLRPLGERLLRERPFTYRFSLHRFLSFEDTPTEDPTVQWFTSAGEQTLYQRMWEGVRDDLRDKLHLSLFESLLPENTGLLDSTVQPPVKPFMDRKANNPPVPVGRLTLQQLNNDNRIPEEVAERLSFNIWDRVPVAHKPLGRVNRMRFFSYEDSLKARVGVRSDATCRDAVLEGED